MDKKTNYYKSIAISISIILFYFLQNIFVGLPLAIFNIDPNNLNNIVKTLYLLIMELMVMGVIIYPYRKEIKTGIKDFIENKDIYFKKYFKYWLLLMALMMISNSIIMALKGDATSATNEEMLREQFLMNPIYIYISAVIVAPIVEELVFRRSLYTIFPTKIIFIIMSGLFFGSVHLMAGMESIVDILYIIPYGIPGVIFAYLYTKTNNITVPISMHIMHNGIQMSIQTLMLLFM